jgi:RimK family alpha-L-glutamate ligase
VTDIVVVHYPSERPQNWALLRKAARERDLRLVTWAPHLLGLFCADGQQTVSYAGRRARPDVVIHRIVAPFRGIVVPALACLAAQGTRVLNDPHAAFRSRDKLLTTLDLARAGVPVVPTLAFDEPGGVNMTALGQAGLVLKPARGVRGEGVAAFGSAAALTAACPRRGPRPEAPGYYAEREHYLAQPLVRGGGQDIRAYVVNGACVAVMRRVAKPGEIRANLAQGAGASPLALTDPAAGVAAAALTASGLDFGGVDMVEDDDGVVRVLEVDAWAGFAGITRVTGTDVAGAILDFAAARGAEQHRARDRAARNAEGAVR